MAIYKLEEIANVFYGKSFEQAQNEKYPVYSTGGVTATTNNPQFKQEGIIVPRVGSMNIFYSNSFHSTKNTAFSIQTKNENIWLTKYIYFVLLKNQNIIFNKKSGSAVPKMTSSDYKNFYVNIPNIITQKKIIDIIEQKEMLFLKYSKCIRIDSVFNANNDFKLLIDIIEPIDMFVEKLNKLIEKMQLLVVNFLNSSKNKKIISDISKINIYRKLINSKELNSNGQYYYSTGKTINSNKKWNEYNFENGISIPYEGAGIIDNDNLFPMLHLEKIYIARKWGIKSELLFSIYYSLLTTKAHSIISVGVKMPNLKLNSLHNITIKCSTSEENAILEKCYYVIDNLKNNVLNLTKIKENILISLIK